MSTARLGAAAAVAALLVLAVGAAAVGAPWRLQARHWRSLDVFGRPAQLPSRSPQPTASPPVAPSTSHHAANLSWLTPVLVALAVLAVAWAVWRLWLRYQQSAVEQRRARQVGASLVLPTAPEVPLLRRGVVAAQRFLDEMADPNNAIVAAWLALEEAAASSGVHRVPSATPTEFTVAVLRSTHADRAATHELLTLYHRARSSAAGVSRADVAAATACLTILARSWNAMTVEAVNAAVNTADG